MYITKVILENFKCYHGISELDMSVTDDKNVVIIYADGGFGKTSFWEAINWAFYNNLYTSGLPKEALPYPASFLNWEIIESSLKKSEKAKMAVTIHFDFEDRDTKENNSYIITNSVIFEPISKTKINITSQEYVLKKIESNGEITNFPDTSSEINKIFPFEIKKYFFFDAEDLGELVLPKNSSEIKKAIFKIVGLEFLEDGASLLNSIAVDFNNQLRSYSTGDLTIKTEEYTELTKAIDQFEKEKKDISDELDEIKRKKTDINNKLATYKESKELQEEQSIKDSNKEILKLNAQSLIIKLKDEISKSAAYLVNKSETELVAKLQELRTSGKIPGTVTKELIDEVLKNSLCICGLELNDINNIKHKEHLENVLDKIKTSGEDANKLLEIYYAVESHKNLILEGSPNIKSINKEILNNDEHIATIETRLKELRKALKDIPLEDIKVLSDKLEEIEKEEKHNNLTTIEKGILIDQKKKRGEELKLEIKELSANDEKTKKIESFLTLTRDSSTTIGDIFKTFSNQTRQEIEEATNRVWHKLIPSSSAMKAEIIHNYSFKITNHLGMEIDIESSVSKGQQQGLIIAFVTAISEASGHYPPYLIDFPFGRLGPGGQTEMAQHLPDLCKQLILLPNEISEYNETTKKYLDHKCNHIYKLDYTNKKTIITKM